MSQDDGYVSEILLHLRKLGKAPEDLLRFFDRKEYYVLHGARARACPLITGVSDVRACVRAGRDADTIAASYFKSRACLKTHRQGGEKHTYLTINKNMAAEVIRSALLEQRRRVEVYRQESRDKWVIDRRGSPGNLQAFEDECMVDGALPADASTVIVPY